MRMTRKTRTKTSLCNLSSALPPDKWLLTQTHFSFLVRPPPGEESFEYNAQIQTPRRQHAPRNYSAVVQAPEKNVNSGGSNSRTI